MCQIHPRVSWKRAAFDILKMVNFTGLTAAGESGPGHCRGAGMEITTGEAEL